MLLLCYLYFNCVRAGEEETKQSGFSTGYIFYHMCRVCLSYVTWVSDEDIKTYPYVLHSSSLVCMLSFILVHGKNASWKKCLLERIPPEYFVTRKKMPPEKKII